MMFSNVYAFVFFFCGLFAFGCGLDDDFTEMKHMIGKLVEENAVLRSEVETIRDHCGEENALLRSEVESIRVQCGEENASLRSDFERITGQWEEVFEENGILREENAILRSEVVNIRGQFGEMRDQVENKVENVRYEMTQMRDDVDALNFRLEGVQQGNYMFKQNIYQVLCRYASKQLLIIV